MGFPGYFLIVQDFIAAARNMGVSVGPGRGSAAGSAVAYCLGITQIDPIKYDLLFERFLNPDRISLPDIDIDFDDDGRGEVLRWVTEKYGHEKVAHIITYGTMATKMAIKDVARVEELPLSESIRLTKLIPDRLPRSQRQITQNKYKKLHCRRSRLTGRLRRRTYTQHDEICPNARRQRKRHRRTCLRDNYLPGRYYRLGSRKHGRR